MPGSPLGRLLGPVVAAVELARLAIESRGRMTGRYWSWRWETAAGGERVPVREKLRAAIEYGRWVASMRRLR